MHLIIISLLFSCQFKPVYVSGNLDNKLCTIIVEDEKTSAEIFEREFKNELKSLLCPSNKGLSNYVLKWDITKNYRELIKSETNTVRRYEETLLVNFSIHNIESKVIIYTDKVSSKGSYNILEDEIISTMASNKSIESQIAILAARLILDKIQLFMLKNENSKL